MRSEEEVRRALDAYGDMVWRVCMVHLKNRDDAQDILQNVLLKFAQHTRPFQSPEHEKAWVLRVAINESRDLLRDAFRSRSVPWEEVLSQQAQPVEEEYRELLRAVLSLPPKYRDAVYLHYYEGYTAAEIGKLLGKNTNTVYTLLTRAREQLRETLGGDRDG